MDIRGEEVRVHHAAFERLRAGASAADGSHQYGRFGRLMGSEMFSGQRLDWGLSARIPFLSTSRQFVQAFSP